MNEYITKASAVSVLLYNQNEYCSAVIPEMEDIPCEDVAPVVHGTWLLRHIGHGHYWECSICHATPIYVTNNTNYCPNCGAKMDEEQEEPTNEK